MVVFYNKPRFRGVTSEDLEVRFISMGLFIDLIFCRNLIHPMSLLQRLRSSIPLQSLCWML